MSPLFIEIIGMLAAVIGTICWLPQTLKVIQTKDTKALSFWTNLLLLITVVLWFIYGIGVGSLPIIIANTAAIILVGTIVIYKIRFG